MILRLLLILSTVASAVSAWAAAPHITGISPVRGGPGTVLTIGGQNFGGLIQVQVGQGRATIQSAGASLITAIVPPDATTGPVAVITTGGEDVSAQTFQAAPRITQFYTELDQFGKGVVPAKGVPGQQLNIEGANFNDPAGAAVYIGNQQAFGAPSADSLFLVTLPNGAQTGPVTVGTSAGSFTSTALVYFNPKITAFTAKAAVGTTIDIYGTSFVGVTSVLFGTAPAVFSILSNTNIQAVVPAAATDGRLTVSAPGGSFITPSNFLILPGITGFTPAGGPVGTVVTINGTGLRNTTSVLFGTTPVTLATNLSSTQIRAVVPAGAFTGTITVATGNGSSQPSATPFYVAPRIDSFDPSSGQPGAVVTLTGANFAGATQVLLGGADVPGFIVAATNRITLTLPENTPSGKWRVITPGGTADSAGTFTSTGRIPTLADFNPKVGPPGTQVTLTGINLNTTTKVEFNGLNAVFSVSGANVIATVPTGATTGPIRVTNPSGQATSSVNFSIGTTADLRITLTPSLNPAVAYSPLAFAVRVVNRGQLPAVNTRISVTFPDGATFDSATGTQDFDVVGRKLTFRPGAIDASGTFSGSVRIRLGSPRTLTASAEAVSDTPEANPADNSASVSLDSTLPQLSLDRLGSSLINLQWPAVATNFALQTSPAIQPATWTPVTDPVANDGTTIQLILTIPASGVPSAFYRLSLSGAP